MGGALRLDALRAGMQALTRRRSVFKRVKGAREGPAGRSAVLLGFCEDARCDHAPSLLLTLRAARMRTHKGEVAFPGGREDPADGADPVTTALRELHEEVGIDAGSVEVLGMSHDLPIPGKLRVTPVVGWLGPIDVADLTLAEAEVQRAFLAPLSVLLDPSHKTWMKGQSAVRLPVYGGAEEKIWGLTAYALHQLFQELGGASLME